MKTLKVIAAAALSVVLASGCTPIGAAAVLFLPIPVDLEGEVAEPEDTDRPEEDPSNDSRR